jgi:hypothetical protein
MPFDPTDLPLAITQWRNVKATQGQVLDTTWGVYLRSKRFRDPALAATKSALTGWSPVAFTEGRRAKKFAERAYGIALDYEPAYALLPKDAPPDYYLTTTRPGATLSQAAELWAPYYGLIHTSFNHQRPIKNEHPAEPGPRFRVILPLSRPITPEEYAQVWTWAAARAEAAGHPIDPSTKDVSRLWYVPGRAQGYPYEVVELTGLPLDPGPICEAAREAEAREAEARAQAEKERAEKAATVRASGGRVSGALLGPAPAGTPSRRAYVAAAMNSAIRALQDAPPGTRNPLLAKQAFALGGFIGTGELTEDEVTLALTTAVTSKGCNPAQIAQTIRNNIAAGRAKPRWPPEAPVRVTASPATPAPEQEPAEPDEPTDADGYDEPAEVQTPAPDGSEEAPERMYEMDEPPDPFGDAPQAPPTPTPAQDDDPDGVWEQIRARDLDDALGELAEAIDADVPESPPPSAPPPSAPPSGRGPGPRPDWRSRLISDRKGIKVIHANTIVYLQYSPGWEDLLEYDAFSDRIIARSCPPSHADLPDQVWPREWEDADDLIVQEYLQRTHSYDATKDNVTAAVITVARRRWNHPVRAYLDSLAWDGVPRIDSWLTKYLGVRTDERNARYVSEAGACWLRSAVARIRRPGCKADCMLVLEGEQGLKKSTAVKTLASPWFIDHLPEIGSKDALAQLRGVWIIELAEMDNFGKAEVSKVKAFLSTCSDRYRASYGRHSRSYDRQCIFVGTCNRNDYLRDDTGGRRFWPVECGEKPIDIEGLKRDRDQLWAEADAQLRSPDAIWWLADPEVTSQAAAEQKQRFLGDAWEDLIERWITTGSPGTGAFTNVSIAEVMDQALGIEAGKWSKADQMRVATCLRRIGFESRRGTSGDRERRWFKVEKQTLCRPTPLTRGRLDEVGRRGWSLV